MSAMAIDPRLEAGEQRSNPSSSATPAPALPPPSQSQQYRALPPLSMTVNPLPPISSRDPADSNGNNTAQQPQSYYGLDSTRLTHTPPDQSSTAVTTTAPATGPPPPSSTSGAPSRGQAGDITDPKRPRACEACRGLKVRCQPDEKNPEGACRRCAKAGRQCIVTAPSRKRQKKTDSRVAELEKKIDALTQSLQAKYTGTGGNMRADSEDSVLDEEGSMEDDEAYERGEPARGRHNVKAEVVPGGKRTTDKSTPSSMGLSPVETRSSVVSAGSKRRHSDDSHVKRAYDRSTKTVVNVNSSVDGQKGQDGSHTAYPFLLPKTPRSGQQSATTPDATYQAPPAAANHEFTDIIDRGLITADQATVFFDRYVNNMTPHFPAVVFSPGTTAGEIRRTKPILFLSIVSAAAGETQPELQRVLNREVLRSLAERIVVNGEKRLELIQALQVSIIWYWPPERHEELNFYQLVHISAAMAMDIGIAKKASPTMNVKWGTWSGWKEKKKSMLPDSSSIEARRAWLVCYFLCQTTSTALRRQNLIRWIPYNSECIDTLETSNDALPSDKYLCRWVKCQHIVEEVGTSFSLDDPFASAPISDPKIQYALRGFERQMNEWESGLENGSSHSLLRLLQHFTNVYIHEVAMHVDHNVDDFGPPWRFTENKEDEPLGPAHISGLTTCLTSAHNYINEFVSLKNETVRALPIIVFVRTMYILVILMKLHFAAVIPKAELGKIFSKDDLKTEEFFSKTISKFQSASEELHCRPIEKFSTLLIMMHRWFAKQGKALEDGNSGAVNPSCGVAHWPGRHMSECYAAETPKPSGPPEYSTASTPLHLLSEVAMGSSSNGVTGGLSTGTTAVGADSPSTGMSKSESNSRYYPPSWANPSTSANNNVQNYASSVPMQGDGGVDYGNADGMGFDNMGVTGFGDLDMSGFGSMFMMGDGDFLSALGASLDGL